jgi:hypothetical protein
MQRATAAAWRARQSLHTRLALQPWQTAHWVGKAGITASIY